MFNHKEEHVDHQMIMMQCNLDDMNPEYAPYVADRLLEAGANDVYWVPIIMKKGRPGMMLNVLVEERLRSEMERIIFKETTTLGVRYWPLSCHRLARKVVKVETEWGAVDVKTGYYQGELVQYAPEFGQCQTIAKDHGIPLKQVYDAVRRSYEKLMDQAAEDEH